MTLWLKTLKNSWAGQPDHSLPGEDFLTESKKFIESTIDKLDVIYYGSESYLKNLLRKNNPEKFTKFWMNKRKKRKKFSIKVIQW